jgi:hypothetical protein
MAQQLFLSLGAQFRTDADGDDARAAQRVVRQWLAKKGITAPHLVMENGSGLSRAERVSARDGRHAASRLEQPVRCRVHQLDADGGHGRHHAQTPQATAMRGEAHIKTGTLNTVRAIAGFSRDSNGNTWAVVAILNDPKPWGASQVLDQCCWTCTGSRSWPTGRRASRPDIDLSRLHEQRRAWRPLSYPPVSHHLARTLPAGAACAAPADRQKSPPV